MTTQKCPQCGETASFSKKRNKYFCSECEFAFDVEVTQSELLSSPKSQRRFKLFLSYGRDEFIQEVKALRDALRLRGHDVWFDEEQLGSGLDWEQRIERGLAWCDRIVLTMTPHSVRRPDGYCLNEIAKALELRKLIIPVLLVEVPQGAPTSICRIQYLDWRDAVPASEKSDRFMQRLVRLCEAIEEDKLDFEGGQQRLIRHLQPLNFDGDLQRHIASFKGRIHLEARLRSWLSDPEGSQALWLTAAPGLGKSAVAATLSHRWAEVGAVHFCVAGHQDKINPARAVLSIAYQLSQREHMDVYASRLANLELEREAHKDARSLFDTLLVGPLAKNFPEPPAPILVILDGLDEASQATGDNLFAEIVAADWCRLPKWLRLMVSSRPEAELVQWLAGTQRIEIRGDDVEQKTDLVDFMRERFIANGHPQSEEVLHNILQRSEGAFHYVVLLIEEVRQGRCDPKDPVDLPAGLNPFYLQTFKRRFPDTSIYRTQIRPLLELILASPEPVPLEVLSGFTKREVSDVRHHLGALGSMLTIEPNESNSDWDSVRLSHTSLRSWLTGFDIIRQPLAGVFLAKIDSKGLASYVLTLWESANQSDKYVQDPAIERNGYVARTLWELLKDAKDVAAMERVALDLSIYWEKRQLSLAIEPGLFAADIAWKKFENDTNEETTLQRSGDCLKHIGDLHLAIGNTTQALEGYRKSLKFRERLIEKNSTNSKWQVDLSFIHNHVGQTLVAQGNLVGALEEFKKSLLIGDRLATQDPSNTSFQKNLSYSYNIIGDVFNSQGNLSKALGEYQKALKIREELFVKLPDNLYVLADLCISQNRIGVVLETQGKLASALEVHLRVLDLIDRLIEKDPDNSKWHEFLSKGHNRIGGILQKQGKFQESLEMFRKGLDINEQLVAKDSKNVWWQSNLSNSYFYIGGVLKHQGDLTQAILMSDKAMKIMESLVKQDPNNSNLQFELIVYLNRDGGLLELQGDKNGAISQLRKSLMLIKSLVSQDPSNKKWQRDLSVSYSRVGDLLLAQGELESALENFTKSLDIFSAMRAQDPTNVNTLRSIALTHNKIGRSFEAQGKIIDALKEFHQSICLIKELVDLDSSNANWQSDLRAGNFRIGRSMVKAGDLVSALEAFRTYLDLSVKFFDSKPEDEKAICNIAYGQACVAWVQTLSGDYKSAESLLALSYNTFKNLVDQKITSAAIDLAICLALLSNLAELSNNSELVVKFDKELFGLDLVLQSEDVKSPFREMFLSLILERYEHALCSPEFEHRLDLISLVARLRELLPRIKNIC